MPNPSEPESCLLKMAGHYLPLNGSDKHFLRQLEQEEFPFFERQILRREGDPLRHLYAVKSGWLYASRILPDGRRQVLRVYYPGDIVGLSDIAFAHATSTLEAATDGCLCPFPKEALDVAFQQSPRLMALMFSLGMVQQVVLLDRLRALGRMSARARLVHFLLEILSRLRITNPEMGCDFSLLLTQEIIGDSLGLTNVYVSRTFQRLVEEGLIQRSNGEIRLLDEAKDAADGRLYRPLRSCRCLLVSRCRYRVSAGPVSVVYEFRSSAAMLNSSLRRTSG